MRDTSHTGSAGQSEKLDRLARRFGKYVLVVGVAKRAHDLKERLRTPLDPSGGGLVNRAIDDIARGDVKISREEPEKEVE